MNKEKLISLLKDRLVTSSSWYVYDLWEKGELIESGDGEFDILNWGREIGTLETYQEILELLDE